MEDDNGLDLGLGLHCGRSSAVSKPANGSSSDTRTEEGERGSKVIDDFKNFLQGGTQKQDPGVVSQKSDLVKPENFFNNLSNSAINEDASTNLGGGGFWVNMSSEVQEEKRLEAGTKRKNLFDEIHNQNKREKESDKTRASHISITTDEGSTAENEDVADSEAEGLTSRLIHRDDGSKRHTGVGGLSEAPKEVHGALDSSGLGVKGQNRFTILSENEFKVRNVHYGLQFPPQSVNIISMPYSKESNPIVGPGTSNYALPGMMHMMPTANSERPASQHVMPANLPMFGYSSLQLPVLDKDNSQGLVPHSQQIHSSHFGRGLQNSDKQNDGLKISQITQSKSSETSHYDGRVELSKGDGKHHATEEGSNSQRGDHVNQSSTSIARANTSAQPRAEGVPSEIQAIRPGMASDLKFGGSGSFPNLPWVTTTGSGPKGRTISGVTYRFSPTQIRIVCACHGSHMSPEEFVQHANEEQSSQENSSGLAFPSNNPAASAQS